MIVSTHLLIHLGVSHARVYTVLFISQHVISKCAQCGNVSMTQYCGCQATMQVLHGSGSCTVMLHAAYCSLNLGLLLCKTVL